MSIAIIGGEPASKKFIPYGKQIIEEDDIEMVINALKGDFITTGPYVKQFESEIANYVGAKYAVAVSNGTAALHTACYAAGIKEGDEVIVTPMTFAASANCILYMGAKPVFVDIDDKTYNIDYKLLEEKITEKTKAIIPVDFTGQPANMDEINKIAKKYKLVVIEDGAHSLGSEYKGKKVGTLADMTEFSFHPVKPITTGEGGVVVTDNEEFYKKMIIFRSHGITRDKNLMIDYHGPWYYEQIGLGYNYRITDIQCALGISQLKKIDKFLNRRRNIAYYYNKNFSNLPQVTIPFIEEDVKSGWHLYVLRLNLNMLKVGRKEIFEALIAENIGVNVHYIPIYYHPYYQKLGYRKGICPKAERLYEEILSLPIHPSMTDEDVENVVKAVKKVIEYYSK